MLTYCAILRPGAATLTPWLADTLFGHLCWMELHRNGEAALKEFLKPFVDHSPAFILSDGFPAGSLPRPMLPGAKHGSAEPKSQQIMGMMEAKRVKNIRLVKLEEFNALRRGEEISLARPQVKASARAVLKNQINRLTGTTTGEKDEPGGGNLYSLEELAILDTSGEKPRGSEICFFIKTIDEEWAKRVEGLLNELAMSGYGAKKSTGYGQFSLSSFSSFNGFDELPGANGFISLSNWVPAQQDPTEGFYNTLVKYGKLGENLAASENPFKFPLVMLAAGSSFYTEGPPSEYYGRMVEWLAPAATQVVQYGFAFAVPAHLRTEE